MVLTPFPFLLTRSSTTAQAIASPSKVLVPRPISSRMTRLWCVALFKMLAVSFISTIKVDCALLRSSMAPTRVKILSTIPILALVAGTKLPICAIRTMRAVWRSTVDLPAMLGPVIMRTSLLVWSRWMSFGTKRPLGMDSSITGCLPSWIMISLSLSTSGRTYLCRLAASPRLARKSILAISDAALSILELSWATLALISQNRRYSSSSRFSSAPTTLSSNSFNSGVMKRSALTRVCFLIK